MLTCGSVVLEENYSGQTNQGKGPARYRHSERRQPDSGFNSNTEDRQGFIPQAIPTLNLTIYEQCYRARVTLSFESWLL